jgi:thiol:disulfide interchange protein
MVSVQFLWLAASAGALSLLTPCVFPMVPITVTYFTQHGAASRSAAVRHAVLFGLGIVATFTALGLLLAILVGATAVALLAANPWVNVALAAVFIAFALNLFGVYQIAVPSRWLTALDRVQRERGVPGRVWSVAGAGLMGLTFTLTSFTCTAPFVGTVLVTAAQGNWRMPFAGMLVYSTVFALPFCVLALVPHWVRRLPRAGSWSGEVKVVMGFVELAAALKFLSNADLVWHWGIFTRPTVLASWVALTVIAAAYVWGVIPSAQTGRNGARTGRLLAGAGSLAIGAWLAWGLAGHPLGELEPFLPPAGSSAATTGDAPIALAWRLNDYPAALRSAKAGHKLVFIDFTGYTCTNCRWMEANMFTRPEVRAALDRYVLSRLFTDGEGDIYERQQALQQAQFNTVALPLYAIVDADGRTVASLAGLTRDPSTFVAFLQRGLDR